MATGGASKVAEDTVKASRNASSFFDRFDKSLLYHASAIYSTEWLLTDTDKSSGGPDGAGSDASAQAQRNLLEGLGGPDAGGHYTLLVPYSYVKSVNIHVLELHQLTRELVEGIFVFNQVPHLSFEPNHDLTSSCALPSAYVDSFVGVLMISLDYFMKSLLHGTTVPVKDQRRKLSEGWKRMPPDSVLEGFREQGLVSLQEDEELGGEKLYAEPRDGFVRYPARCVDHELAVEELPSRLTTGEEAAQQQSHVARDVCLRFLNQVSISLVFRQESVRQSGSVLLLNPVYDVTTSVVFGAGESEKDAELLPHLHSYLQRQRSFVAENLPKKQDTVRLLELLGFVSFMIPFLVSLKRQNKIVDVDALVERISKESIRTERELPPALPSKTSRWSPYTTENSVSSMNGGVLFHQLTQTVQPLALDMSELPTSLSDKEIPVVIHNDKSYHVLRLPVESYYPQSPRLPLWVHAMTAELRSQSSRLLPLSDSRLQELLRKPCGPRHAARLSTASALLQAGVERGMLPVVANLLRRCTRTRLTKVDKTGRSLVHCATLHGRADNLSALLLAGCDAGQPLHTAGDSPQPTRTLPIHLAAAAGGLATVCCLLRHGADPGARDDNGWAPIHHSAFHNYQALVTHFASWDSACIDLRSENRDNATPLLLAARNGGLDAVQRLIELGADVTASDAASRNVVHTAALGHHTSILQLLLDLQSSSLDVCAELSGMLAADPSTGYPAATACCLDTLTRWRPALAGPLQRHGAVASLTKLLSGEVKVQGLAVQVLRNLSECEAVQEALVQAGAAPPLVRLLATPSDHAHACACVVLSDLGLVPDSQAAIAQAGALPLLVGLLGSESSDVRLYSCACLGILAYDSAKNQTSVLEASGLPSLVSLLSSPLSCVQACAASALQAVVEGNRGNQLHALSCGAVAALVRLLRSRKVAVHVGAARALGALAEGCEESQRELLGNATAIHLLKRLLKMRDPAVKVSGGCALWAIAGRLISNKRCIATHMGLELLVDMLTIHDKHLDYVCSEALGSLATELGDNQSRIAVVGGVKPLVEVLTSQTSQGVMLSVIHTLAALVTRPALVPNPELQAALATARGITVLAALISSEAASELVRVEAACTLAKLVLGNTANSRYLARYTSFSYQTVFQFFSSPDPVVQLLAGYCLAVSAFNSPNKLEQIRSIGLLDMALFLPFLEAPDELFQVYAAFQIVVLSRLLSGVCDVAAAVRGIRLLVSLCSSEVERTKVLSAEFLACLAHSPGGIPNTMVMAGVLDPLYVNLR